MNKAEKLDHIKRCLDNTAKPENYEDLGLLYFARTFLPACQGFKQGEIHYKMEKNFTAKSGDPQTMMVISRPHGASNAFVYEFKPNTNENYFKVTGELDRQKIIENNQWSERLLGNSVAQGFAKDAFLDELRVKEVSVLREYRNKLLRALNLVIQEAALFANEDWSGHGLDIRSSIDDMGASMSIEKRKQVLDAFGVGVRAGAITPTQTDEEFFRGMLDISKADENVLESWDEDGGYRRPITLKGSEDSESEMSRVGNETNGNDSDSE